MMDELNNSMDLNTFRETASCAAIEEISNIL
jgi:hypothetical protein